MIELLVVFSIIAILVAAASASWTNAQAKARDGKRKSDLKAVQQALELYFQTNGKYPSSNVLSGQIICNVTGDSSTKSWGSIFTCGSITYLQQLPKEVGSTPYFYVSPTDFTYTLSAWLENSSDPDLTGLLCTPAGPRNYCVTNP